MSGESRLQNLRWSLETNTAAGWAENVNTFTDRLAIIEPISVRGLRHEKREPGRVVQYKDEGTEHIPGVYSGSFSFKVYMTGHGSTTASATALRSLMKLLGWFLGGSQVSASSGDTITGGTDNIPTTTGGSGFDARSLARIGAYGDGDGNGQFVAVSGHAGNNLTLLTNIDGAPVNGAVLYSAELAYAAVTSYLLQSARFLVQTRNNQYMARGCFPMSARLTGTNPGELGAWEFTVGVSYFEPLAETFPTTDTFDSGSGPFTPAPNTRGSFFFNTHGTATRVLLDTIRTMALEINLGVTPIPGFGGNWEGQNIVGARRQTGAYYLDLMIDAAAASTSPTHYTAWLTGGKKHGLFTGNPGIGSAWGFYAQCMRYVGDRPTQEDQNGFNAVPLRFQIYTNETVTTDELTLSPLIFAAA